MNTKLKIKLSTFDEIKIFADKVTMLASDVDIIKGSVVYDAKSIMAIFNMGTLEGVYIEIHSDDEKEIVKFNEIMKEFIVF